MKVNAFTWILLAFPAYLLLNGKLVRYLSFAAEENAQAGNRE